MFSLIDAWTNVWVNNQDDGDLRRHCAQYNVTVMWHQKMVYDIRKWFSYIGNSHRFRYQKVSFFIPENRFLYQKIHSDIKKNHFQMSGVIAEWPWRYRSTSKVIAHDTPSNASVVIICAKYGKNPSRTVHVVKRTRQDVPYCSSFTANSWLNNLEDTGQCQRSLHATNSLMLMIICAKYGTTATTNTTHTHTTSWCWGIIS